MKLFLFWLLILPFVTTVLTAPIREPEVSYKNGGESRDAVRSIESHEMEIKVVVNDNTPSGRKTGVEKDSVGVMYMSRGLVQDCGTREWTDHDSEEGLTVDAHKEDGILSGKQDVLLIRDKVTDSVQRKAERVNGSNGMLAQGQSIEMLDLDSLEENNDRLAAAGNSRDTDYDETGEDISSETYPIAAQGHMPSHLSVPAKSGALW